MKWKTQIVVVALIGVLVLPLFATGQKEEGRTTTTDVLLVNPAGEYPIVNERITMTAFIGPMPGVDDYQDNAFTHYLEERTNISLDIDAPQTDASQRRNILLASGDYPELLISYGGLSSAQQYLYGSQGVFLALNDYIDEYGVNTRRLFDEFPRVLRNFTMPDGKIYSLPGYDGALHVRHSMKMWVYEPWLDSLGLAMPETTDEFRALLVAIRDGDPNGNGDSTDEIPMAGAVGWWNGGVDGFLMNAFIYSSSSTSNGASADRLRVVDGRVDAIYDEPEFRRGLEFISGLYADGLIAPESLVQDRAQFIQMGEAPGAPILGVAAGGHQGGFTNMGGESGRLAQYSAIPPLEGPAGVRVTPTYPLEGAPSWIITDKSKHPAAAFRLGDALKDLDFTIRNWYGRKGIEWDDPLPGELGIGGVPAVWVPLVARGQIPGDAWWNQVGGVAATPGFRATMGAVRGSDPENDIEVILQTETQNKYLPYGVDVSAVMPQVTFDEATAAEYVELRSALNEYVNEMVARFIVGDADIDLLWNGYLDELETIGLNRYLEILQDSYDNWAGNK
jgi:putative aldouronate transport system substrate-binding protein